MGFVNLINQPNWAVTLKMHLFGFVSSCCDTYFLITVAADSSYQLLLSKRVLKPLQQQPNLTQLIPWQRRGGSSHDGLRVLSSHFSFGSDHSKSFIVCHNLTVGCHGDLWLQLIYTDLWETKAGQKRSVVQMEIFRTNRQI